MLVTDDQQALLPPQPPDGHLGGHPDGQSGGQQADGPAQHGGRVTRSQTRKHRQINPLFEHLEIFQFWFLKSVNFLVKL